MIVCQSERVVGDTEADGQVMEACEWRRSLFGTEAVAKQAASLLTSEPEVLIAEIESGHVEQQLGLLGKKKTCLAKYIKQKAFNTRVCKAYMTQYRSCERKLVHVLTQY